MNRFLLLFLSPFIQLIKYIPSISFLVIFYLTVQSESISAPACVFLGVRVRSGPQSPQKSHWFRQYCGSRWSCACGRAAWCDGGAWVSQVGRTGGGGYKGEGEAAAGAEGRLPLWCARASTWPTGWAGGWPDLGWGRPPSALVRSGPRRWPSRSAGIGWAFLGGVPRAGRGWEGWEGQWGPEPLTQCWAGPADRSAACCELTPSLGTVRERMRSYQPERSLYAALWCVTHMGMQACTKVVCIASACTVHSLSISFNHVFKWPTHSVTFLPSQKERKVAG